MIKNKFNPFPIGEVRDWHRPHNEACPHNINSSLHCSCAKPKRTRKPYRVMKVHDSGVLHGARPDIVMEVHPQGRLVLREAGRRKRNSYATTVAEVFNRLVTNEAIAKMRARNKAKADAKKARKLARKRR